jgi:phage terminase large subunit-like protein
MQAYSQSLLSFNRPTKEFERLLLSNKVKFLTNEITAFCFRNVVMKSDHNGNVKPIKDVRDKKIDGVIAAIMSIAGYLLTPRYSNTI